MSESAAAVSLLPRVSASARGLLAALVTVLIWTAFIVVARASADPSRAPTLTPMDIVMARMLGAGLVLIPVGWWITRQLRQTARLAGSVQLPGSLWGLSPLPLRTTVLAGLFGGVLYPIIAYTGFVYAPAAHASVLMPGSLPLWTSIFALVLLAEKLTPARIAGLVCIVAGDLLVGGPSLLHAFEGGDTWRGDVLFILAAVSWSLYSVLVRKFGWQAVHATTAITVFSTLAFAPVYAALVASGLVQGHIFTAPWRDVVFQMLMQGVGSVVISGITFNLMIRHYGPVRSTMITALVPGLSALSAAVFLAEPLHWNVLLGLSLVTAGILFGVRKTAQASR